MAFDTRIFFGRPGNLHTIHHPKGVFDATRSRSTSAFPLGAGGFRIDAMIGGARTYAISYEGLTREAFGVLQAYADGLEGPGPFALLDPGQRNMLPANIAGATSVTYDTSQFAAVGNFTVAGSGCTIASSSAYSDAGPRVLAWTFNNAAPGSAAVLTPRWPSSTFTLGVPVAAGRPLCFSCWVRGGGTDAVVTYTPQLRYLDATGTTLSTTSGSATASASGAWTQMYATATPPAGTYWATWRIPYTSGVSAGSIGYFRRFMLNEGTTPDATWMPGTGVWPVRPVDLADRWEGQWPEFRSGPGFVLAEDTS